MWHTSTGDRILAPAEAELYLAVVGTMLDDLDLAIDLDDPHMADDAGIHVYDMLSLPQRQRGLAFVAQALTDTTVEMPQLTAQLEGIAYAPFAILLDLIQREIEFQQFEDAQDQALDATPFFWRWLTLNTLVTVAPTVFQSALRADLDHERATSLEDAWDDCYFPTGSENIVLEHWETAIEELAERIFWDHDWDLFGDRSPEAWETPHAQSIMAVVGLDSDYFSPPSLFDHAIPVSLDLAQIKPHINAHSQNIASFDDQSLLALKQQMTQLRTETMQVLAQEITSVDSGG